MRAICVEFAAAHADDLAGLDAFKSGHDLWMASHGCGFSDRQLGEVGQRLDEAAMEMPDRSLYIGTGALLYLEG